MSHAVLSSGMAVTGVGAGLIAVSYGLVRFSYGQFLPAIRAELGLGETLAGAISAALFLGNCIALLIAASATARFGPRAVASLAAACATLGLAGMSLAPTPWIFAISMLIAGSATGLSMPPLVAAVMIRVSSQKQNAAITFMNAGTSIGVILSGPVAIYFSGAWRLAYGGFATLALITAIATLAILPGRQRARPSMVRRPLGVWRTKETHPLLLSAFVFGAIYTVVWTYGGDMLARLGGWESAAISWFWILTGVAGLLGAPAANCVAHFGVRAVHIFSYLVTATAIILLGMAPIHPTFPILSAVLFGAIYILQSGLYMVWGMALMPRQPAAIVAAAFFMLPLGQVVGSVLMGLALDLTEPQYALFGFVMLSLFCASVQPRVAGANTAPAH